ncbi:MAG TPA: glycosyl hydrolase family 28-related protein [Vicinamibacterales bacterium]|nr:glycosyl hydrolase family 28-related protein [Vicinamibacterales bacterium]
MSKRIVFIACLLAMAAPAVAGTSYYTVRLDDPKAVHLEAFGARGDGVADDSDAIQRAIDRVHETVGPGIVFVPEGRYRITRTIDVWPSIRLIGYGATRPVIVLGPNTPGYQDRNAERQMIFFAGSRPGFGRPGAPPAAAPVPGARPPDASPGTFYSAISNIDIEIGEANHGAVAVRGTYAQHCFLAHMDIRVGPGIAGVHDTGNVMEDVRFFGGTYGIWTRTPSPGWQFTAVDTYFEGQREAAIRERAAGLTLVRPHFRNVPAAVSIDEDSHDELWIKDGRMEEISGPAILIGLEENPRTQINFENVVCRRVPSFARLRKSGKTFAAPGEIYEVKVFSHGLHYAGIRAAPAIVDVFEANALEAMPEPVASDLVPLPPAGSWVNVHALGAKGDGVTDDTEAFRRAIASHRAIFLPMGYYVISDTLTLRPETVIVGLHPLVTALVLLDRTEAFQGVGPPKAMIETPKGGTNVMIGVGVYTNGINPRAVGVKWMAGARSMMNDVRFLGGHGTNNLDGTRANPYNNSRTADPDANRRWDSQYPSLWVTDGGGGTFFDIWTPSTFAMSGMLISDTTTEGRVYQMSSEHHVRYEIQVRNAANWRIYAMQTEEERGESPFALPLEVVDSENITFANFHLYRVISSYQPFPWAVKVSNSRNIRFRNFHCYSNSKVSFDAAVVDEDSGAEIRQREFAWLDVPGRAPAGRTQVGRGSAGQGSVESSVARSNILEPGAEVRRLATGFFNISGGAAVPSGDFFFVDARRQRIYRWDVSRSRLSVERDTPLEPVNLAADRAGNLMVVSYGGNGTVYAFEPGSPIDQLSVLEPVDATLRPELTAVRPVGDWRVARDPETGQAVRRPFHYLSPDGTTYISAGRDFTTGAQSWGVKSADLLRGFGLAAARPGQPFYVTSESEVTTWRGTLAPDGNLEGLEVFVQQGGEGVAVDAEGRVYLAAGHIQVYDPNGRPIETIEVPERPTQLVFGGADGKTLFICARTSLYAVRTQVPGRQP